MRSRPAPGSARRIVAAWFFAVATVVLATGGAQRAGASGSSPDRASPSPAALVLDDQSEWVVAPGGSPTASAPLPSAPFDLDVTARHTPAGALLGVSLYSRLGSRYDFKSTVRNGPSGSPLATTTPVPVADLPPAPHAASGVALDLSVVQTVSSGQGMRVGLACAPPTGTGTCTGVYPVVVQLRSRKGRVLHHFTTFLTYVAGESAHPLDLAWVVPVTAPAKVSGDPSRPGRSAEVLSATDSATLETLVSDVRSAPSVPLTFDVSPETLEGLDAAGPAGRAAEASLAALSSDQATDEVLSAPYVPINLGALSGAGEPTEIRAQMAAGATVLHKLRVRTTTPSAWVQTGTVGNDISGGLTEVGATELVVPDVDLAHTPNATTSGTWASTFSLTFTGKSGTGGKTTTSVESAETDTWLDGQFTALHGDPVLAATQLLADLAMVHFERPNTTAVRGMVAVPPSHWVATGAFDRVLLDGLSQNPVVAPVTLSGFFASVAGGGPRQLLDSGRGPVLRHSVARSVSAARLRLSAFDGAVVGRPAVTADLDHLLLASESDELSARRQASRLVAFGQALTEQLHLVSFAAERTFTLTARTGWIPITVESRATYTVRGALSVTGNKFVFPRGDTRRVMRLDHATNLRRVDVEARSSGDLPLRVVFTSPNGRLVFASRVLTVRSTATSVVGIVLTVLALATLLTWWASTWRAGRRKRRLRKTRDGQGAVARP